MNLETPQWTTPEKINQVTSILEDFDTEQILNDDVLKCAIDQAKCFQLRQSISHNALFAGLELHLAQLTLREEFELCAQLLINFPELGQPGIE